MFINYGGMKMSELEKMFKGEYFDGVFVEIEVLCS